MSKTKKRKKIVRPQYISKEQRAKMAPKKPMAKELKYGIIFCAVALVVAIILFVLLYDDGSLAMQGDSVVMEENWLVANKGSSSEPKFYKVGEVAPMAGFALDEGGVDTSSTNMYLYNYHPEDTDSRASRYYVTGINGKAQDSAQSARDNFTMFYADMEVSEVQTASVHGHEFYYFITKMLPVTPEAEAEGEGEEEATADETPDAEDTGEPVEGEEAPVGDAATGEGDAEGEEAPADDADDASTDEAEAPVDDATTDEGDAEDAGDATGDEEAPADDTATEEETQPLEQQIVVYIPAIRDTTVLFAVTVPYSDELPPLTEDELVEIAHEILHTITLEEKK